MKSLFIIAFICIYSACSTYQATSIAREIRDRLPESDASRTYLMRGTVYETPAYIFESGKQGPAVLILGGTHGDEPAGYESALRWVDRFLKKPPVIGTVIIVPEANKQAVIHYKRRIPVPEGIDRERGNLNRCYPGKPDGLPMEILAFEIEQLVKQYDISILLDLHEALYFHLEIEEVADEKGLGQTLIYHPNEAGSWLVMNLLDQINSEIKVGKKKFSALERPIPHSASWWAGNTLDIAAFTFETSRKTDLDERINYHLRLVEIVLRTEGILP